jgi:Rieske Fe-S protein
MNERRRFLKVVGTAALAATFPACTGTDPNSGSSSGAPAGVPGTSAPKVADVPMGGLVRGPGTTLVGRDAGGIYAMSSLCTHDKCDLRSQSTLKVDTIVCACHGSTYTLDGTRVSGPAPSSLQHFKVTVAADTTISVDAGTPVGASVRAAVA